jgi:pimeloyl-ACP methyl ester carboxylesterase
MGGVFALYYLLNRDPEPNSKYLIFGAPLFLNWGFFFHKMKQPESTYDLLVDCKKKALPVKALLGEMTRNKAVYARICQDSLIPSFTDFDYIRTVGKMIRVVNANFGRITKDVLFLYGQKDAITDLKKVARQNAPMKNIRTIVVPEEYHSMMWADKELYVGAIREWLGVHQVGISTANSDNLYTTSNTCLLPMPLWL